MEEAAIKIRIANQDAAMKARFGTNVRQNCRMEKNVFVIVTAHVAIAGAQVDVAQKFRMEELR